MESIDVTFTPFTCKKYPDGDLWDLLTGPHLASLGKAVKSRLTAHGKALASLLVQQKLLDLVEKFPSKFYLPGSQRVNLPFDAKLTEEGKAAQAKLIYDYRVGCGKLALGEAERAYAKVQSLDFNEEVSAIFP